MANLFKGIVKLSQSQYETLIKNKTLTVNNTTINYDENVVYVVENVKVTVDTNQTITGDKDFTGKITLNNKELSLKEESVNLSENQEIQGQKDFVGTLYYKGKEVAVKEEIPAVSDSLDIEYKDNAMAVNQGILLNEKITALIENVNGRVQSFSAANLQGLGNLFGIDIGEVKDEYIVPANTITYKGKEYSLKTGDIFLIVDVAVPDYWFSLEDMKLFKMETSKVDLSGFVTDEEFESLTEEVNKKADQVSLDQTNQNVSSNTTKIEELENNKLERTDLPNINGNNDYNSSNNFYAPTFKGNYGQLLMSNGSGAPSWTNMPDIQGSVTLSSILPSEYQEVEYLECDGGQLIDTEVISNGEDFKMEGKTYAPTDAGRSYNYVFSSADTIDGPSGHYFYPGSNMNGYGFEISYPVSMFNKYLSLSVEDLFEKFINWSFVLHKEHKTGRKDKLEILTEEGKEYFTEYTSTNSIANAKIILFSNNNKGEETRSFVGKAGKFKIYVDGVIQRDLIPCYRKEDDVIGYYDLLNGMFYENLGTRPFVKGPDMPADTIKQYQFMAQNIYQGTKTLADTYVPIERTISGKTLGKDIQLELNDMKGFDWYSSSIALGNLLEKEYYKTTNILPVTGIGKTFSLNGIDFTRNADGSITMNGTSTNYGEFRLNRFDEVTGESKLALDENKTYRYSIQKISGSITGYVSEENYLNDIASSGIGFRYNGSNNSGKITSVGKYFDATGYYELSHIYITFISNYTYDNFTIGIRVEEIPKDGKTFLVGQGPIVHQKELEEAIGNIDTVETDPTVPEHVKTISEADISNWNNKLDSFTETDPTVPSYVKSISQTDINNWNNKVDSNVSNLDNYTLSTGVGSKLDLSIDTSTYIMTLKLKNSSGTVLDTKTIDLPLETMVVGASYNSSKKEITLTLKNGTTTSFSVADLVSGLASSSDLANYLPKSGGTMTGPIVISGGDATTTGNIQLDTNGQITAKGTTQTLFGRNSATNLLVGHSSHSLTMRGSATRPTYNGSNMALYNDIPTDYAKLSGGNTFTGVQHIKGTAANKPLWVRGIQGCLEDGVTENELHLNYQSNHPVKWGYDANGQLNSDGTITEAGTLLSNKYVTLATSQTISGTKTFNAPTNSANTEQATVKFKTANGGAIILGKEGSNSGTMIRLDQADGTTRLQFRASNTAGAMVWRQPESGAALYFDFGPDAKRVTMPTSGGTLALTSQIPNVSNYLPKSGGTMTGDLNMNNCSITGVNNLVIVDPGAGEGIEWAGGNGWKIYEADNALGNNAGNLQFVTGSTRRMTIETSGALNVTERITSSLSTNTHISGNQGKAIINSTAGAGYNMLFRMKSSNGVFTGGAYNADFNIYYTADSTISAGTNSITKATKLMNESGDASFGNNVSVAGYVNASSDKRLKENIIDVDENSLKSFIENTPIKAFNYKSNGNRTVGVIAQDIENLEINGAKFTNVDEDGFLQVHETKFVYLLWNYCQQLNKRIKELESKVK